jgi:tetratricopeptide (TPR) repeat protein
MPQRGEAPQKDVVRTESTASSAAVESVPPKVRAEFDRAIADMRAGRDAQGQPRLEALAAANPGLGGLQANLGLIHERAGRYEDAEKALKAAVRINPGQPAYYNLLGVFYRGRGDFGQARKAYETALARNPDFSPAHLNLAILFDIYLWEPEKAKVHYERYAQLAPESTGQVTRWLAELKTRSTSGRIAKGGN